MAAEELLFEQRRLFEERKFWQSQYINAISKIEGMKAANENCKLNGEPPDYYEDDFYNVVKNL